MPDTAVVQSLILEHRHLVPPIVREFKTRLPRHVRADDLTSAGNLGLVQAARSYQPGRGSTFPSWAKLRIRGAIGDELRSMDWAPRGTTERAVVLSLDGFTPAVAANLAPDPTTDTEQAALARLEAVQLQQAVTQLPAHLQLVVHAAFYSDRTHREAAAEVGIPPGDFYLLRSEAIRAIRAKLGVTGPAGGHGVALPRRLAAFARLTAAGRARSVTLRLPVASPKRRPTA